MTRGAAVHEQHLMILFLGTPPPLTQHTAAKRPTAPTHECIGPASTDPRRIATEEKGRVSGPRRANQSRYE